METPALLSRCYYCRIENSLYFWHLHPWMRAWNEIIYVFIDPLTGRMSCACLLTILFYILWCMPLYCLHQSCVKWRAWRDWNFLKDCLDNCDLFHCLLLTETLLRNFSVCTKPWNRERNSSTMLLPSMQALVEITVSILCDECEWMVIFLYLVNYLLYKFPLPHQHIKRS